MSDTVNTKLQERLKNISEEKAKEKEPIREKVSEKVNEKVVVVKTTEKGEISATFTGALWARIDIEKAYKAMLRELPKYYKKIKEEEVKKNVRS